MTKPKCGQSSKNAVTDSLSSGNNTRSGSSIGHSQQLPLLPAQCDENFESATVCSRKVSSTDGLSSHLSSLTVDVTAVQLPVRQMRTQKPKLPVKPLSARKNAKKSNVISTNRVPSSVSYHTCSVFDSENDTNALSDDGSNGSNLFVVNPAFQPADLESPLKETEKFAKRRCEHRKSDTEPAPKRRLRKSEISFKANTSQTSSIIVVSEESSQIASQKNTCSLSQQPNSVGQLANSSDSEPVSKRQRQDEECLTSTNITQNTTINLYSDSDSNSDSCPEVRCGWSSHDYDSYDEDDYNRIVDGIYHFPEPSVSNEIVYLGTQPVVYPNDTNAHSNSSPPDDGISATIISPRAPNKSASTTQPNLVIPVSNQSYFTSVNASKSDQALMASCVDTPLSDMNEISTVTNSIKQAVSSQKDPLQINANTSSSSIVKFVKELNQQVCTGIGDVNMSCGINQHVPLGETNSSLTTSMVKPTELVVSPLKTSHKMDFDANASRTAKSIKRNVLPKESSSNLDSSIPIKPSSRCDTQQDSDNSFVYENEAYAPALKDEKPLEVLPPSLPPKRRKGRPSKSQLAAEKLYEEQLANYEAAKKARRTFKPVVLPTKPYVRSLKGDNSDSFKQKRHTHSRKVETQSDDFDDSDNSGEDNESGGAYLAGISAFTAPKKSNVNLSQFQGSTTAVYPMAASRLHNGPMTLMDYLNRSTFLRIAPHDRKIYEQMIRAHAINQLDDFMNKHQAVALNREGIRERANNIKIDVSGVCDACERSGRLVLSKFGDPVSKETRPHMLVTTDTQDVHAAKVTIRNPLFAKSVARLPDLRLNSYNMEKLITMIFPPHTRRIPQDPVAVHTCQEYYGTFECSKRKIITPARMRYIRPLIVCRTVYSKDNLVQQSQYLLKRITQRRYRPWFTANKDRPHRRTSSVPPHADASCVSTSRAIGTMCIRISRSMSPVRRFHLASSKNKACAVKCRYIFDGEVFTTAEGKTVGLNDGYNDEQPSPYATRDDKNRRFFYAMPQVHAGFCAFFYFNSSEQAILMPARPAGYHAINGFRFKRCDFNFLNQQHIRMFEFTVIEDTLFEYLTRIRYGNLNHTFYELRPASKFGSVMPTRALYNYLRLLRKEPKPLVWKKFQSSNARDPGSFPPKRSTSSLDFEKIAKRRTPVKVPFSLLDVLKFVGMYCVKVVTPNPKFAVMSAYEKVERGKTARTLLDLMKQSNQCVGVFAESTPEWRTIVRYFDLICRGKTGKFSVKENDIFYTRVLHLPQKNPTTKLMCVRIEKPLTMFEQVAVNNSIFEFWRLFQSIRQSDSDSKEFDTTPDSDYDWGYSSTIYSLNDPEYVYPNTFLFNEYRDVIIYDFRNKDISNVIPNSKYLKDKIELHRKKTLAIPAVIQDSLKRKSKCEKNYRRWDESSEEEIQEPSPVSTPNPQPTIMPTTIVALPPVSMVAAEPKAQPAIVNSKKFIDNEADNMDYDIPEADIDVPDKSTLLFSELPDYETPWSVPDEDLSSSDPDEGISVAYDWDDKDKHYLLLDNLLNQNTPTTIANKLPDIDLGPPLPTYSQYHSCGCKRAANDLFPCEVHPYGLYPKKSTREKLLQVPNLVIKYSTPSKRVPVDNRTQMPLLKIQNMSIDFQTLESQYRGHYLERQEHKHIEMLLLQDLLKKIKDTEYASLTQYVNVKLLHLPFNFKIKLHKKKSRYKSSVKFVPSLVVHCIDKTAPQNTQQNEQPSGVVPYLRSQTTSDNQCCDSVVHEVLFNLVTTVSRTVDSQKKSMEADIQPTPVFSKLNDFGSNIDHVQVSAKNVIAIRDETSMFEDLHVVEIPENLRQTSCSAGCKFDFKVNITCTSYPSKNLKIQWPCELAQLTLDRLVHYLKSFKKCLRAEIKKPVVVKPKEFIHNVRAFLVDEEIPSKECVKKLKMEMLQFIHLHYSSAEIFLKTEKYCHLRPFETNQEEGNMMDFVSYTNYNTYKFWKSIQTFRDKLNYGRNASTVAKLARLSETETQLIELQLNRFRKTMKIKRTQSCDPLFIRYSWKSNRPSSKINEVFSYDSPDDKSGIELVMERDFNITRKNFRILRSMSQESLPDIVNACFFETRA